MLTLRGRSFHSCDGITRRDALRVGALAFSGLTLPGMLKAREAAGSGDTAVIFVELAGGPTQIETYDPKPLAPSSFRGPLSAIDTALPGVQFSEMMSHQARHADSLAVIRSIWHNSGSHSTSAHLTQTGYYLRDRQNRENEMPCLGSVVSRMRGPNAVGVPPFVSIPRVMRYGTAAYLGKGHNPFATGGDPAKKGFAVKNLSLDKALSIDRLDERKELLARFDRVRAVVDNRGVGDAMDHFSHQAFEMVTGPRAQQAFDIAREPDGVRDAYGRSTIGQSLLLARRLVEAGVTCVTVRVGGWDDHKQMVRRLKTKAPQYDQGVATLIDDLRQRGLDRQVLVVAMGEFGRTPRVNKTAGRDHWGRVMSVMMAGGGLRMGQVIGSSNSKAERPEAAPYRPENVLAMVYRHLGIAPETTFDDFAGRPRYVLEEHGLIDELV